MGNRRAVLIVALVLIDALLLLPGCSKKRASRGPVPNPPRLQFRAVALEPVATMADKFTDPDDPDFVFHVYREVLMNEGDVFAVAPVPGDNGRHAIELEFTDDGRKRMELLSARMLDRRLAIILDGRPISVPLITGQISDRALVQGNEWSAAERDGILVALRDAVARRPAP